jgi:hypothetical protein
MQAQTVVYSDGQLDVLADIVAFLREHRRKRLSKSIIVFDRSKTEFPNETNFDEFMADHNEIEFA